MYCDKGLIYIKKIIFLTANLKIWVNIIIITENLSTSQNELILHVTYI